MAVSELDFRPSAQNGAAASFSIRLTIPLGSKSGKSSHSTALMPSIGMEGYTMVENSTALSDRQRVHGSFVASNLLSAFYCNDEDEKQTPTPKVWTMSIPTALTSRFRCIQPLNKKGNEAVWCFDGIATRGSALQKVFNSIRSRSYSIPEVRVRLNSLWESTGGVPIVNDLEPPAYNSTSILIPVSVSFQNHLSKAAAHSTRHSALSVTCEANAIWLAQRSFATDKHSPKITDSRCVQQSSIVVFPPICPAMSYDACRLSDSSLDVAQLPCESYCSQGMIELSVPSIISIPSIESTLLQIKYSLNLDLKFTLQDASCSDRTSTLSCKATIPLSVSNGS